MQQYSLNLPSLPVTELPQTEAMGEDGGGADGTSHPNSVATQEGNGQVEGEHSGDGSEVSCGGNGNSL